MNGRKIPDRYENIIDSIFISYSEYMVPYLYLMGFTPNIITTISLIFGILCSIFIYRKQYIIAFILWLLAYLFDCCDGFFARKYSMTSKFGDYYDHGCDLLKTLLVNCVIIKSDIRIEYKFIFILLQLLLGFLSLWHMGCQQKFYDNSMNAVNDEFLSKFKILCQNKDNIKYSKFFSSGTFVILVGIFICCIPLLK